MNDVCLSGTVTDNRHLCGDYHRLEVGRLDRAIPPPDPGRFLMLRVSAGTDPLLRRPFGIHDFAPAADGSARLAILYRVCGRGTSLMTRLRTGDRADILGPLGRGFDLSLAGEGRAVILGGGIGAAPLLYLARRLVARGIRPHVFLGGGCGTDVLGLEAFRELGLEVAEATMDGSLGFRGTVLDAFLRSGRADGGVGALYVCGPWPMMARTADLCRERGWRMEGAVEARMACGMGLCLGCAVQGAPAAPERYRMVCRDGPVFSLEDLAWTNPDSA
jgi:dihydroorotate dehydrogenase electron transfer subunit